MPRGIVDALISGEPDALERAVDLEVLRHAVGRRIMCPITKTVLDVRTAVYFAIKTEAGKTGSEVVAGVAWDGAYGDAVRARCEELSIEITDTIDGRELHPTRPV